MVKIAGIMMIITSSGFLGSYIYKTLRNRCDILREILVSIDILQAEIVFKRADIHCAIKVAEKRTKGYTSHFWNTVGKHIGENDPTEQAFRQALTELKAKGITKEDVDVISTIAGIIGKYDSFDQAQMLKNVKDLIHIQWEESNKELKEKGKLYRALGISFGIVVALVVA